jgi:hypothetical protein
MYLGEDLRELNFVYGTLTEGTEEENSASDLTNRRCIYCKRYRVKQSRNRPGVAQRVPGGLGSEISMTFST